jgi:hypothetical protein
LIAERRTQLPEPLHLLDDLVRGERGSPLPELHEAVDLPLAVPELSAPGEDALAVGERLAEPEPHRGLGGVGEGVEVAEDLGALLSRAEGVELADLAAQGGEDRVRPEAELLRDDARDVVGVDPGGRPQPAPCGPLLGPRQGGVDDRSALV